MHPHPGGARENSSCFVGHGGGRKGRSASSLGRPGMSLPCGPAKFRHLLSLVCWSRKGPVAFDAQRTQPRQRVELRGAVSWLCPRSTPEGPGGGHRRWPVLPRKVLTLSEDAVDPGFPGRGWKGGCWGSWAFES